MRRRPASRRNLTTSRPAEGPRDFTAVRGHQPLRLLSHNIQVGIATHRYRDYLTGGWKHLLPSADRDRSLAALGPTLAHFDIIGLQEADAGSIRSRFLNQAEQLAELAELDHWAVRVNRDLGQFGKHALGLISRIAPGHVEQCPLPGRMPGRGALVADFLWDGHPLRVISTHLALSRRARNWQFDQLGTLCDVPGHVVVMADFNCEPHDPGMQQWCIENGLKLPLRPPLTYPRWRPQRAIDHIAVSQGLDIRGAEARPIGGSDHIPVAMSLALPSFRLPGEPWGADTAVVDTTDRTRGDRD
ncbi:MAG: endonuclease/exonuclease/phosphatase family protein [Halothiobacillaceae bacterium]|nr:endonuclease/exonuclease/phosphatase family protein [Halothiobacillaceae bacterium]